MQAIESPVTLELLFVVVVVVVVDELRLANSALILLGSIGAIGYPLPLVVTLLSLLTLKPPGLLLALVEYSVVDVE